MASALVGSLPFETSTIRDVISMGMLGAMYRDDPPRPAVRLAMLDSCRSGDITRLKGARKVEPIAVEIDVGQRQQQAFNRVLSFARSG